MFTFGSSSLLGDDRFSTFFGICFPILRMEWELLESAGNISEEVAICSFLPLTAVGYCCFLAPLFANIFLQQLQFNPGLWEGDISIIIKHMLATSPKEVNGEILTCLFWRLLGSFSKIAAETEPLVGDPFSYFDIYTFFLLFRHLICSLSFCRIRMRTGYAAFGICSSFLYPVQTMSSRNICLILLQNASSRHHTSSQSSLLMKVSRQCLLTSSSFCIIFAITNSSFCASVFS